MPREAAFFSNCGQCAPAAVSSMRTARPSRMARRHGPSPSAYCTRSTSAATGSLHATVTGRPPDRIVMPQDKPGLVRRAASTAMSCKNW
jgi:hypothetical protein